MHSCVGLPILMSQRRGETLTGNLESGWFKLDSNTQFCVPISMPNRMSDSLTGNRERFSLETDRHLCLDIYPFQFYPFQVIL